MEAAGVALPGFDIFVLGAENFEVMFYELYGCYVIAAVTELYGVTAGACTDVGDFDSRGLAGASTPLSNHLFDIVHGGAEFYLTMAGCETVFFVEFVVVFF